MKALQFKVLIAAPREAVWHALWDEDNYRAWTSVFSEGSTVESDWKEGSKIKFLDGKGSGLSSLIAKRTENEFMSFKHMVEMRDGVEIYDDPKAEVWRGAMENYTLKNVDGNTQLTVDLDSVEEFEDYFTRSFPLALDKVKTIAEALKTAGLSFNDN